MLFKSVPACFESITQCAEERLALFRLERPQPCAILCQNSERLDVVHSGRNYSGNTLVQYLEFERLQWPIILTRGQSNRLLGVIGATCILSSIMNCSVTLVYRSSEMSSCGYRLLYCISKTEKFIGTVFHVRLPDT